MKKDISNINGLDYDFTIIGTGFAGITLAIALSKKGLCIETLEKDIVSNPNLSIELWSSNNISFGISKKCKFI